MNHDTYSPDYIRDILKSTRVIALVGASANTVRPSYLVMKYLMAKGYKVVPVNPGLAGQELLGQRVYASLRDIGEAIDMVDIFRNPDAVSGLVAEAIAMTSPPKTIWMQLQVRNDEAAAQAEAAGMRVVMNRCTKIEYGKLSGEWGWVGGNTGLISSRRQNLHESGRLQSLGLGDGPSDKKLPS